MPALAQIVAEVNGAGVVIVTVFRHMPAEGAVGRRFAEVIGAGVIVIATQSRIDIAVKHEDTRAVDA